MWHLSAKHSDTGVLQINVLGGVPCATMYALPSGECSRSLPKSTQCGAPNLTLPFARADSPNRLSRSLLAFGRGSTNVEPKFVDHLKLAVGPMTPAGLQNAQTQLS